MIPMLYPFLTAPDETEISYSEVLHKASHPEVRVFVEKWDTERNAFNSLELYLPSGRITQCVGFSKAEAQKNITKHNAYSALKGCHLGMR